MNREILFRGKRKDNGEWVIGHLFSQVYFPDTIEEDWLWFIKPIGSRSIGCSVTVDPSTVGQYTGLTDKNGKKVFEGDIVRFTERRLGGEDVPVVEAVEFSEGGFATHRYFLNNWLRNALQGNYQLEDIEAIGNIHDNPELLEEAKC